MDPRILPLYYLSSLAGLIMVAGGIWLLYTQKIYIDRESKAITEIETPVGKFKTNLPALVLFALGFVPLIYPMFKLGVLPEEIRIKGLVRANRYPVHVYAAIVSEPILQDRGFSLKVPTSNKDYKIIYIAGNVVLEDSVEPGRSREIQLPAKHIGLIATETFESGVPAVPPEFR